MRNWGSDGYKLYGECTLLVPNSNLVDSWLSKPGDPIMRNYLLLGLVLIGLVVGASEVLGQHWRPGRPPIIRNTSPSSFSYTVIYATEDGETHFRDDTAPMKQMPLPAGDPVTIGGMMTATKTQFVGFQPRWNQEGLKNKRFHNAAVVQWVVGLQGSATVMVSDGETRRFAKGSLLRVLDVAPSRGHITAIDDEPAVLMFIE
jgi:hypothetical protein